ncbi:hypothetical protein M1742_24920 [Salmonella enterica subsp. enterica serovar Typhimurium]|uniref:three-helix bundle dimerization domain-containing protein n=1 Tax=Bacteria TaxID=2 RepID=UPI0006FCD2B6|nr:MULTISPECIES: hypothetical protein [Bacteria]MBN9197026.1 hypothetical protein [Microbacterium ginsengisoli]KQR94180.1 hypothetical protein ASG00_14040 [Microbacterium sp. Leaf351]KQR95731.1 hypothetical protein ASF93_14035 [Microbacterium sp. Leaf347]MCT6962782.1 hypothetical protein [Salmonella enterica subsp. enterica serovar Typhimurium]OJU76985.1 MAG: hypothetical protein BGO15_05635 [Microbacterium sp. 71-23]
MSNVVDETEPLADVVRRLHQRFPAIPTERVADAVMAAYYRFDGARIRDFIPVLVERAARNTLLPLAV